ncbi:MAG: hypothetical protein AB2L18_03715 [Anaerolineaceae bacterium]
MKTELPGYRFDLKKDRFWLWIAALPLGLICWALPFISWWGLIRTGLEEGTSIFIAFLFLGLPAYLVGWIFVYSFMEGLITHVSFSDTEIYYRTPSLIFPLFWKTKKIKIADIQNINFFAPFGLRTAILLFVQRGKKTKKYFLPRFKNQPEYLREFQTFSKENEPFIEGNLNQENMSAETMAKTKLLEVANANQPSVFGWDRLLRFISGVLAFTVILGSGYYCLQLPLSGFESFSMGVSVGMIFVLICLVLSIPIASQVLIWFFAKKAILFVFLVFNIHSDALFLPSALQKLFQEWTKSETIRLTLTDFIFWCILFLSFLYSAERILRNYNRGMKSRELFN